MGALKDFNIYIINYWVLIPAVSIILLLSLLEKRHSRRDVCHGRPALLFPFHFLDGYDNRMAYSMAFGTAINTVVSLIMSVRTLEIDLPLWAEALYVYLQAIVGCLTCFPLFACLTTRYTAIGAILSIGYSFLWLALNLTYVGAEFDKLDQANSSRFLLNVVKARIVLSGLPVIMCYLMLIVYSVCILYKCFSTGKYFNTRMESTVNPHQEEHVRWVFRKFKIQHSAHNNRNSNSTRTFIDQMKSNGELRYFTNFPFFKYPTRIVVLAFVQLNILYWAGILLMVVTVIALQWISSAEFYIFLQEFQDDLPIMLITSLGPALIGCITNTLMQIFVAIRNYRYDMLTIYQRRRALLFVSTWTPQNILTRSMAFPGYQVAFMLWGIIVCFITAFCITFLPVLFLYIAAKLGVLNDLLLNLAQVLSFPAIVLVVFYLLVFMSKRVLLQEKVQITDKNPPLNVDNRKFYEIVNYYSLFTNMAVGLFTCLFRILETSFFGLCSVGRLDRSVFPRELESRDRGHAAYISMLLVDNAHNNPCMRVFAHLLWTKTLAARIKQVESQEMPSDIVLLVSNPRHTTNGTDPAINSNYSGNIKALSDSNDFQVSKQARTRWYLACTLINNPQLCKLRKRKLKQHRHEQTMGNHRRPTADVPVPGGSPSGGLERANETER